MPRWIALTLAFFGGGTAFALLLLTVALILGPTVEIRAYDFGFEPGTIRIPEAGRYWVVLTNAGTATHDLTFEDGTRIEAPGGVTTSRVVMLSDDRFEFHCSHHDGRGGMAGRIVVEP